MDHENLRSTTPSMLQELAARYHLLAVLIKKTPPLGENLAGPCLAFLKAKHKKYKRQSLTLGRTKAEGKPDPAQSPYYRALFGGHRTVIVEMQEGHRKEKGLI
jgi:hypothetical protein